VKIETLKELEAMLKVCRKQGVTSISVDGIQLQLGDLPAEKLSAEPLKEQVEDAYSAEDIAFWSTGAIS